MGKIPRRGIERILPPGPKQAGEFKM